MARKSSPMQDDELTALNDPFDGSAAYEEPFDPPPPPRSGPTCGQLIGGCLEIALITLIAVMVCGLISGAAVWLGEDRGLLPDTPPTAVLGILDRLPTVAALNVPTLAVAPSAERTLEVDATAAPGTPAPSGLVCADGAAWWFSQTDTFDALATALPSLASGADNAAALRLRLTPRRESLASESPACLETPHTALLAAFDAVLPGLDAAEAGDSAALDAHAATATRTLARTLTALWDMGVFTAPDAPTTRAIARGSGGGDCASEDWHAALAPLWTAFTAEAETARTATALNLNLAIGRMNTQIEQASTLEAPACVSEVNRLALNWMTATTDAFRAQVSGDAAARQAHTDQAAQTLVLLRAWEDWLGLPAL